MALATAFASMVAMGQACKVDIDQAAIDKAKKKYEGIMQGISQETKKKAKKIEDDNDGTIINGHFETRRMDFSFDVPEVKVVDQKMSMDVPETTMKTQTWSFDFIEIVVEPVCRPGPDVPRFENKTCHNDTPSFDYPCPETRMVPGPDVCLPSPTSRTVRKEIKLDIPEFTMKRVEWVMGVPETKLVTQKFAFDYPVMIVDTIETKADKAKKDSKELSTSANTQVAAVSAAMKTELSSITRAPVIAAFDCQEEQIKKAMRGAWDKMADASAAIAVNLKKARESNSAPAIAAFEVVQREFNTKKDAMLTSYVATRRDIATKRRQAIAALK